MQSKRRRVLKIIIISAVILIVGGVFAYRFLKPVAKPKINTAEVTRGTVSNTISATGVLQALTTVDVKSNVGGQVVKLLVDEGERIQIGDVIANIDPADSQTALNQSQADFDSALSKVAQSKSQFDMQKKQGAQSVNSAKEALIAAQQRLAQAKAQAGAQPVLTSASIKQAESALSSAKASLKQTKDVLMPQKLASARSSFDQANATLDLANEDMNRKQQLYDKGFIAKSEVDAAVKSQRVANAQLVAAQNTLSNVESDVNEDLNSAQAKVDQANASLENAKANGIQDTLKQQDVKSAEAAVRQAEAALASARAGLTQNEIREGDITQANSQLSRSQAALKNAATQLGYTTITSPCTGVVVKKYVDVGSIVSGGRSSSLGTGAGVTIVQIADVTRMFAQVNIDETDIAKISVGQSVDVTIDAYPDELFEGKVTKIAPLAVVDQNVTTIPVTVEVDNPDIRLKPNMNVNCEFIIDRRVGVLSIPSEAIKETAKGDGSVSTVQVMGADGKQVTREVTVGLAGNSTTEITGGLIEGEVVITSIEQPEKTTTPASGGRMPGMGGGRGPR